MKRFEQATSKPHGYLVIDLKSSTPELDRLRDTIFDFNTIKKRKLTDDNYSYLSGDGHSSEDNCENAIVVDDEDNNDDDNDDDNNDDDKDTQNEKMKESILFHGPQASVEGRSSKKNACVLTYGKNGLKNL
jgi:hypothetical protein